jgi:hypothetical protein
MDRQAHNKNLEHRQIVRTCKPASMMEYNASRERERERAGRLVQIVKQDENAKKII